MVVLRATAASPGPGRAPALPRRFSRHIAWSSFSMRARKSRPGSEGRPRWPTPRSGRGLVLGAGQGHSGPQRDRLIVPWTVALESLRHDDSRMLVASHTHAMRYVIDHFPVPWSFVPSDRETLDLMMRWYDIGTLVITPQQAERLSQGGDLPGFERVRSITMPVTGMSYFVYKRAHLGPDGPPEGSCRAHAPRAMNGRGKGLERSC